MNHPYHALVYRRNHVAIPFFPCRGGARSARRKLQARMTVHPKTLRRHPYPPPQIADLNSTHRPPVKTKIAFGCRTLSVLKGCGFRFNPIDTKATNHPVAAIASQIAGFKFKTAHSKTPPHNRAEPQSCTGAASLRPSPHDLSTIASPPPHKSRISHSNRTADPKFPLCYNPLVASRVHSQTLVPQKTKIKST
jgi:hypothetical protein